MLPWLRLFLLLLHSRPRQMLCLSPLKRSMLYLPHSSLLLLSKPSLPLPHSLHSSRLPPPQL
ncbi:hypothetical protein BGV47_16290 [Burkholderia ubonensis]|nr:hypothetical protein BGV47_16290 [Burkholderia ubonensis]OJB29494.1 hypothetical protein BGV55_15440 [Burkholderia ubonensis]